MITIGGAAPDMATQAELDTVAGGKLARQGGAQTLLNYYVVTDPAYGADPTGAVDATSAIQATFNAAAAASAGAIKSTTNGTSSYSLYPTVYVPDGLYSVTASLVLPIGVNLELGRSAIIRATATIAAPMLIMSSLTAIAQHFTIEGGVWDANFLAQDCISLPYFAHVKLTDNQLLNPTRHFLVLGDTGASSNSYEAVIRGLDTRRDRGQNPPTGCYGIWFRNATDNEVIQAVLNGVDVGMRVDTGGNQFTQVHVWNFGSTTAPSICFDDNYGGTQNNYIGCYADGPTQYGWRLLKGAGSIIGGRAFCNPNTADNVAIAVRNDFATGSFNIYGLSIEGTPSHRWAKDVDGDVTQADIQLRNNTYVTTPYNGTRARSRGLRMRNEANQTALYIEQPVGNTADLFSGANSAGTFVSRFTAAGEVVGTGFAPSIKTVGSANALTTADGTVLVNGGHQITLPDPATVPVGRTYKIKAIGGSNATVVTAAGTLDAGATLLPGTHGEYTTNGTNWYLTGGSVSAGLAIPVPATNQYFYFASPSGVTTVNTLGNGNLRLSPWVVERPITLTRLAAEVTTIGDVGSKIRLGVYSDTGTLLPNALLVDAGQIAGDATGVQELTISLALAPGVYWIGGAVQAVTTTQPTLRAVSNWTPPFNLPAGTTLPGAGSSLLGWTQASVTGALPSTFTASSTSGSMMRVIGRVG